MVRHLTPLLVVASGGMALAQADAPPQHNLVTFFDKCRAGAEVSVAYIGGSITEANGWRPYTTEWLRRQFPDAKITEVNAAIGGTGSLLGAFRMGKHVMQFAPDLLFVEFAVNDSGTPDDSVKATMEGIVRQAWSAQKKPDIVFAYTTAGNLDTPTARHQAVADAYGIPSVDFQEAIRALCVPGIVDWPILAADRVHPGDWGHGIYAATMATFLSHQMALTEAVPPPAELPPATFSDVYTTARLIPVTELAPDGWQRLDPDGRFLDGSVMATEAGQTLEVPFEGTQVGVYFEIRENAGIVLCEVDGKVVGEVDSSWGPTYRFNRHNCQILTDSLEPGPHVLKLAVTDRRHELSHGSEFRVGYVMVAG
jgi:hypothetical protein